MPNGGQSISVTTPRAADGGDPLPVERAGGSRGVHVDVRPCGQFHVVGAVMVVGRLHLDVRMLQSPACCNSSEPTRLTSNISMCSRNGNKNLLMFVKHIKKHTPQD